MVIKKCGFKTKHLAEQSLRKLSFNHFINMKKHPKKLIISTIVYHLLRSKTNHFRAINSRIRTQKSK